MRATLQRSATLPAILFALLVGSLTDGCGAKPVPRGPNVLLVTIDTLRADHLGLYGYDRDTSPALDRFAEEAIVFEHAYAHAPFTAPSHASLFTSLYPDGHGVLSWGYELAGEARTFAERFGAAGWRTGAFYNHPGLDSCDVTRGFDEVQLRWFEPAADTVEAFLEWTAKDDRPFAAWVHFWDVHRPYGYRDWTAEILVDHVDQDGEALSYGESRFGPTPRSVKIGRLETFYNVKPDKRERLNVAGLGEVPMQERDWEYVADRYDGGIQYVDRALGEFFDGLRARGLLEDTLVIVTSDHGESLREREPCWFTHDPFLYEETLRVPLIVRLPGGFGGGARVETLARGIDVLPTMLEAADLAATGTLGRSLLPLIRGEELAPAYLFAQTQTRNAKESARHAEPDQGWLEHRVAVSDGAHKLVRRLDEGREELYDLRADPEETDDRIDDPALVEVAARLRQRLDAFLALPRAGTSTGTMDPELEQLLTDIGYVSDPEQPR